MLPRFYRALAAFVLVLYWPVAALAQTPDLGPSLGIPDAMADPTRSASENEEDQRWALHGQTTFLLQ